MRDMLEQTPDGLESLHITVEVSLRLSILRDLGAARTAYSKRSIMTLHCGTLI
jgi:hypothetical protein